MKILLTGGGSGGHVSPALAVARLLQHDDPAVQLLYVGGKLTMEGATGPSIEEQLVTPTGIPFVAIRGGKLPRHARGLTTIKRLWGVVPGCAEAWRVVRRFRPDVVFSTGGYVSLPVVLAAWILRIPIVVHEQTAAVGLTNQIAGRLATTIAVTFSSSKRYFPPSRVIVTGNPIREQVLQPTRPVDSAVATWLEQVDRPVVYITGGGLGSHVINVAVEEALTALLERYCVVHQTGDHQGFGDYARLDQHRLTLPEALRQRYWCAKSFTADEVGWIYAHAVMAVARAGANTVLELAAVGLPTIFIPIPWVTHDEQTQNAQILVEAGTSVILPEAQLSAETLSRALADLEQRLPKLSTARTRAQALVHRQAAQQLTQLIRQAGAR